MDSLYNNIYMQICNIVVTNNNYSMLTFISIWISRLEILIKEFELLPVNDLNTEFGFILREYMTARDITLQCMHSILIFRIQKSSLNMSYV